MVDEAEARVDAQKKSMEISRLSHDFTRVVSPIDGQISHIIIAPGQPGPNPINHSGVGRLDVRLLRYADEPTLHSQRPSMRAGSSCPKRGLEFQS